VGAQAIIRAGGMEALYGVPFGFFFQPFIVVVL
jgi:hypothetical protein